ncbi:MAG: hypothetical protein DRN06_02970 [Thermoprotei archaeon]|nr:MAG: hypothetical protein DRN06_02970 [Thermoprotei archaeon]
MIEVLGRDVTILKPNETVNEYGDKEITFEEISVKAIVSRPDWKNMGLRETERGLTFVDYVKLGFEVDVDINIGYHVIVDGVEYRIVRVNEYPDHKEAIGVAET